jgi:hypothetical protein
MFVYVFTTWCSPVVNFKTLKLFRIGIFPILGNVIVTASVVVYVVFWCILFFHGTVVLHWLSLPILLETVQCITLNQDIRKEAIKFKFKCKWYSQLSAESEPTDISDG